LAFEPQLQYRNPLQPSLDGNTVDEQVEMTKFAKNSLDFQASFQFLNGKFKGLKNAIRGE
jgi:flagellar basal-body rod protein FlgB